LIGENAERQHYVNIFNDLGADWETIVNARDTQRETDFIQSILPKKATTLDLCCGTGRHSMILSQRGWTMIGLDLSKNLLSIAKRNMKNKGVNFPLVRADMRHFPFRNQIFDAVICMFTSFGYLSSESEDIKSFKEVRRTLRKSGKFLLDVANKDHVIKVFQEREWAEFESFYMMEKRSLNLQTSRLLSQWTIIRKDTKEVRLFQHNVRLYAFQTLKQMLSEAGLKVKEVYGGYDKKEFTLDSSRMIMLAERTVN
jgi:ubiquinone/menaquinone biosynthesis C-methylase UbiE